MGNQVRSNLLRSTVSSRRRTSRVDVRGTCAEVAAEGDTVVLVLFFSTPVASVPRPAAAWPKLAENLH